MNVQTMDRLVRQACEGKVVRKLDELAVQLAGVGLFVFWAYRNDESKETFVAGCDRNLPDFCRLFHSVADGRSRCITCHRLLALSGQNGVTLKENVCHGGASVLIAPVTESGLPEGIEIMVVSTCAFSLTDRKRGWRMARVRAKDLNVDLKTLRKAYKSLPELRGRRLKAAQLIMDAAASAVAGAVRAGMESQPDYKENALAAAPSVRPDEELRAALRLVQEEPQRLTGRPTGAALVDVVRSLVSANPRMRISEADIARVSRITPNYFSTLFRKFTGRTFLEFLLEKRLEVARKLLRDLTLSIGEVAARSGFSDAGYFAKVFHKQTGTAPGEWRRRL